MKIMAKDSSAKARQQTSQLSETTLSERSLTTPLHRTTRASNETNRTGNEPNEHDPSKAKIEALANIICASGNEPAAALLALMAALETSTDPNVLAHTVKHFAFTRCGELNVYEMIDTQIGMLERELLAHV
jgi:hypothetical protein